jgi:hypothetical protein
MFYYIISTTYQKNGRPMLLSNISGLSNSVKLHNCEIDTEVY